MASTFFSDGNNAAVNICMEGTLSSHAVMFQMHVLKRVPSEEWGPWSHHSWTGWPHMHRALGSEQELSELALGGTGM